MKSRRNGPEPSTRYDDDDDDDDDHNFQRSTKKCILYVAFIILT